MVTNINDIFSLTPIVGKYSECYYEVSINEIICIKMLQKKDFIIFT